MSVTPGLHIRPATGEDAEAIGVIQVACWQQRLNRWAPQWFVHQFNAATQAEKYATRIADPTHITFVAQSAGHVIGFASAKPNDDEPLSFAYQIGALYVQPGHEGEGAGTQLLAALIAEHRRRHIPSTLVWTFTANAPACAVYVKGGGHLLPYTNTGQMDLDIPHSCFGWTF